MFEEIILKLEKEFRSIKEETLKKSMVSSEKLFKLNASYTLKCLLTTNFQFRALSGKKIQLGNSLNTNGKKENCINDVLQVDDL